MPFALLAITSGSCPFFAILKVSVVRRCARPSWSDRPLLPRRRRFHHLLHRTERERRDVETVGPLLVGKELHVLRSGAQRSRALFAEELGRGHRDELGTLRQEGGAHVLVLAPVDGAGGV